MKNARKLRSIASSVRGARSMGVETEASREAPAALAAANRHLSKAVAGCSQWDSPKTLQSLDALESAAQELAQALGLPAFRSRGNAVLDSGYQGETS